MKYWKLLGISGAVCVVLLGLVNVWADDASTTGGRSTPPQEVIDAFTAEDAAQCGKFTQLETAKQALPVCRKAAEQRDAKAQFNLAFMSFEKGTSVKENAIEAMKWLKKATDQWGLTSEYTTISYGHLVNKSVLTHDGESVGQVISKLITNPKSEHLMALIQPYMEPYSVLCNKAIPANAGLHSKILTNILSFYPEGSAQPAWAAITREGHFQVYFNDTKIRVFLKGSSPEASFSKYHSVIRHPINDIIISSNGHIKTIEVYTFDNNYSKAEINLNLKPYVLNVSDFHFTPVKTPIDIGGLEEFFKQGVILKAIEVDDKNKLFLYGMHSSDQTVSGKPLSLSDFAVVYRSVFHYGHNAPYISLDKNDDNRYAKVNFGGLLQNTRVGSVVLGADKLFKALSTGLDPNSHKLIGKNIVKMIPGFLTEDARSLLGKEFVKAKIRYWFYPDKIGTVTDGNIGAITSYQFFADVERMDKKVKVGSAQRQTIDHLNQNFSQYERAFHTFRELSTVGRMMALVTWLNGMGTDKKVDLDALLSVKLPTITTPQITKKMLAITALTSPANQTLSPRYVRKNSKVFYLSRLLAKEEPASSDDRFLQVAGNYLKTIDQDKLDPIEYRQLKLKISTREKKIKDLELRLAKMETTLNRYNQQDVDYYNSLVRKYQLMIQRYNVMIGQIKDFNLKSRQIVSVGGGINLRPNSFKKIVHDAHSKRISEIKQAKERMARLEAGNPRRGWIRNSVASGIHAYTNRLPLNRRP